MSDTTNVIGQDSNIDTYAVPTFKVSRWSPTIKQFRVPKVVYDSVKWGRNAGENWSTHFDDEDLRNQVRAEYHKTGVCVITCDQTDMSVVLRKVRRRDI